ncbi:MAG TPA: DUF1566 domain-containing protein [Polyangiaceae bacterium]
MLRHLSRLSLFAFIVASAACSADDVSSSSNVTGGGAGAGVSGPGSGGSAVGTSGVGGSDSSGGASAGGGSGATGGSSGQAGTGGAGSTTVDAGNADSAAPSCTPGTGTVVVGGSSLLDKKTCLVWEKAASTALMTNKDAAKHCDALNLDGFSDWRVPAPEELVTWPNLSVNSNAYITNPIYIPISLTSEREGCISNSHSCNISEYSTGKIECAWQGVGFQGPVVCVRGTAVPGTTASMFAATNCGACQMGLNTFKVANCLPY